MLLLLLWLSQILSDAVFLSANTLAGTRLREFAFILKRFAEISVNSRIIFDFEITIGLLFPIHHLDKGVRDFWIELFTSLFTDILSGLFLRPCISVRTVAG
jgi:hypothetical protein